MKHTVGRLAWIAGAAQFFAAQLLVGSRWTVPYSWARNNISDLGNAHCALQAEPTPRYVCSPGHALMNLSFVLLGALLVLGTIAGGTLWRRGRAATAARVLLVLAGAGFVTAGLAPSDVHENQHVLGALLIMGGGNAGLLLASRGLSARAGRTPRAAAAVLGAVALTAFCLFLSHHYLALGIGGMERVAAFPVLLWTAVTAAWGSRRTPRHQLPSTPAPRHDPEPARG